MVSGWESKIKKLRTFRMINWSEIVIRSDMDSHYTARYDNDTSVPGERHEAHTGTDPNFRRAGLRILSELFLRRRSRGPAQRSRQHSQDRPPGGLAREDRRAAYRIRRAYL